MFDDYETMDPCKEHEAFQRDWFDSQEAEQPPYVDGPF